MERVGFPYLVWKTNKVKCSVANQSAHIDIRCYGMEVAQHSHDYHQLVIPLNGWLEMDIEGQADLVCAGTAAVVPSRSMHSFMGSVSNQFLIFDVSDIESNGVSTTFWERVIEQPFLELDATLGGFCGFIAREAGLRGLGGVRSMLITEMLVNALQRQNTFFAEQVPPPLNIATAFVDVNFCEPITVLDVANASNVSLTRLHRLFRTCFDVTPKQYIRIQRLRKAAILLKIGKTKISEIAQQVGYSDQSAFSRAFERQYSTTPLRFRTEQFRTSTIGSGEQELHKTDRKSQDFVLLFE